MSARYESANRALRDFGRRRLGCWTARAQRYVGAACRAGSFKSTLGLSNRELNYFRVAAIVERENRVRLAFL